MITLLDITVINIHFFENLVTLQCLVLHVAHIKNHSYNMQNISLYHIFKKRKKNCVKLRGFGFKWVAVSWYALN